MRLKDEEVRTFSSKSSVLTKLAKERRLNTLRKKVRKYKPEIKKIQASSSRNISNRSIQVKNGVSQA